MKKALWIGGSVLAALAVAGVLLGPALYERLRGPATPLGRVREVRAIATYGEPNQLPPSPGTQFWLIEIDAQSGAFDPGTGQSGDELLKNISLIDDAGNRHPLWNGKYIAQFVDQEFRVTAFELVFSLPQDRRPQSLQVGDAPAAELP